MTDLIIVGDEAYSPEELERYMRQRQREKERKRLYLSRPEVKERRRAYYREYARRRRAGRQYYHLTVDELDERIKTYQDRLKRLIAERSIREKRRREAA